MSAADYRWKLEPHVCGACFGRVLSCRSDGRQSFRCSNCGAEWTAEAKRGCACGIKLAGRDAGIRCVPNDRQRPELLSEFIAKEAG